MLGLPKNDKRAMKDDRHALILANSCISCPHGSHSTPPAFCIDERGGVQKLTVGLFDHAAKSENAK
jgi:hypothetical protein